MGRRGWQRRVAAVIAAGVVLAFGAAIALACIWLAAWDWQGTTTSPGDRRRLHWAAAVTTIVATFVATGILIAGFRRPPDAAAGRPAWPDDVRPD